MRLTALAERRGGMQGKKYGSLMEFALFGGEDEQIDIQTLIATKIKAEKTPAKKEDPQPVLSAKE